MYQFAKQGASYGSLYMVFAVIMLFVTMWVIYLFPYLARFEIKTRLLLKNCALIAIGNIGKTILLLILLVAAVLICYVFPPALLLIPAVYMLLANYILEKIFLKYMSPEDIEAEKERNQDYFN